MSLFDRIVMQETAPAPTLFDRVVMESALPPNALDIFFERVPALLAKNYSVHGAVIDHKLSFVDDNGQKATLYLKIGGKPRKLTVQSAGSQWLAQLHTPQGEVLRSGTGAKAFLALGAMQAEPAPKPAHGQDNDPYAIYKGKKYRVVGYKANGKLVDLAWFGDATKGFTVRTDHDQLQLHDPNQPPAKIERAPALSQLTASPPKPKHVAAPTPTPGASILKAQDVTLGVYKGKKYRVVGYHHGGNVVELAWFNDPTKSFKIATKKVQVTDPPGGPDQTLASKPEGGDAFYRFSTTLVNGKALKDRGVDVVRVKGPDGAPIGGAKRTQRTGGWRDRILQKFTQLSGLKVHGFGDTKTKFHTPPSTADWELIKEKIDVLKGVTAYFHKPKGWHQTALVVKVG
jgi:hypothetical protein